VLSGRLDAHEGQRAGARLALMRVESPAQHGSDYVTERKGVELQRHEY